MVLIHEGQCQYLHQVSLGDPADNGSTQSPGVVIQVAGAPEPRSFSCPNKAGSEESHHILITILILAFPLQGRCGMIHTWCLEQEDMVPIPEQGDREPESSNELSHSLSDKEAPCSFSSLQ